MKKKSKNSKISSKNKNQEMLEACVESYRQINTTSFQQNFKLLLGHYKRVGKAQETTFKLD